MSALQHNKTHMSDNNPSGAPSATPGANASEPAAFGSFGATRGAGLARGKRAATPTAPAASAPSGGYKPSSLEVITPKSEYVNPFTGEAAANAPVVNEPAPPAAAQPVEAPAKVDVPVAAPAPVAYVAPAPPASPAAAEAPAQAPELFPLDGPASPAAKAELNILPTEDVKRPAVNWESSTAQPQREERPTFRTERNRRDDRAPESREPRPFEPREPRRDERKFEPRGQPYHHYDDREETQEAAPAPAAAPVKQSGGFFGWLKSLFGGGKSAETPATGGEQRHNRDGDQGGRRRHRGGRGRNRGGFQGENRGGFQGENRGPRDGQQQPRDPREDGGQSYGGGEGFQGGGRRRRRGGRGRFQGGGDDRGPRPEGQQGGGAI